VINRLCNQTMLVGDLTGLTGDSVVSVTNVHCTIQYAILRSLEGWSGGGVGRGGGG